MVKGPAFPGASRSPDVVGLVVGSADADGPAVAPDDGGGLIGGP
jgi:hypothetical protein